MRIKNFSFKNIIFYNGPPLCSKLKIFDKKFLSRMILRTYDLRPFLSVEFKFGNENFVKPSGKPPKYQSPKIHSVTSNYEIPIIADFQLKSIIAGSNSVCVIKFTESPLLGQVVSAHIKFLSSS